MGLDGPNLVPPTCRTPASKDTNDFVSGFHTGTMRITSARSDEPSPSWRMRLCFCRGYPLRRGGIP